MTSRAVTAAHDPPSIALPGILTVLGALLLFAVPASLLELWGFAYITPSGAAWEKLHPATDLIVLAIAIRSLGVANPLRWFGAQFQRFPGVAALLAVVVFLAVYLIKVQRAPFTPVIDTFVMPPLLFLLLVDLGRRGRAAIEIGLHLFLVANALVGIAEFLTGWRLIPLTLDGLTLTADIEWRASGLMGHPLASAATAGLYSVIIALGFGRLLPGWCRLPMLGLQIVALGAFGGRTALVVTIVCLVTIATLSLAAVLAGRRFDLRLAAVSLLAMPLLAGAAFALFGSGFFDQLLDRFVDDNGSAKSRAIIFNLFSYLSWPEILFGPDQDHLSTLLHLEGIEVGVESFWIGFVMLCGLWMSLLLFVTLGAFMAHVMARTDRKAFILLGFFGLIISTSISLSAKSTSLGEFVVLVMILMPASGPIAMAGKPRLGAR